MKKFLILLFLAQVSNTLAAGNLKGLEGLTVSEALCALGLVDSDCGDFIEECDYDPNNDYDYSDDTLENLVSNYIKDWQFNTKKGIRLYEDAYRGLKNRIGLATSQQPRE